MNESETITAAEIAEIIDVTKMTILRWAENESWIYTAGGNNIRNYLVDSLPSDIQERIIRYRYGIEDDDLAEMVNNFEIRIAPEKLKNPRVGGQVRMVCECLAVPKFMEGRKKRIQEIAEHYGYHQGTAYRLMKRVRNGHVLVNGKRNHGASFPELGITLRAWDENSGRMAIETLMENKRSHAEKLSLYNKVIEKSKNLGYSVGSYRSFLTISERINASLKTFRDSGARGLKEDVIPAIRRDQTAYRPMECLVGDQHKADYFCIDYNGDVATLELFCWLDFRTQLVWGAVAYKHYNRYTVGQALINAVKWGLPGIVYTDWGKPEESDYMTLLIEQLTGIGVTAQNVRHVNARVRNAQAKPIEGWFGWLDRNLRNAQIPGYCKRLKDSRENELQQKELKEIIRAGELLSIPDLVDKVFKVIDQWNNHQFKNRGVDNGKSPLDIYNEETKRHPVTALSQDVLDYIFLPLHETTIRRSQANIKHPWLGTLTYYDPELANHTGDKATVRFNPFDPSRVWVFVGKSLVCQAEEWGMINPKNKDQVSQRIEQQNHLLKLIRDRYRAYLPEKKTIPRIGPHEREARQVARAKGEDSRSKIRSNDDIRVMRTPLDDVDMETGEILAEAVGGDSFIDRFRLKYARENNL
ncbi:MAG: Mu transposase C-terminal domain-containing protein, partial [Thermodesulfobacteriota bacterium]|nr:Mu transposase C-terminal domain-containing protein [Thermodesulfobacteriota bacterium]